MLPIFNHDFYLPTSRDSQQSQSDLTKMMMASTSRHCSSQATSAHAMKREQTPDVEIIASTSQDHPSQITAADVLKAELEDEFGDVLDEHETYYDPDERIWASRIYGCQACQNTQTICVVRFEKHRVVLCEKCDQAGKGSMSCSPTFSHEIHVFEEDRLDYTLEKKNRAKERKRQRLAPDDIGRESQSASLAPVLERHREQVLLNLRDLMRDNRNNSRTRESVKAILESANEVLAYNGVQVIEPRLVKLD